MNGKVQLIGWFRQIYRVVLVIGLIAFVVYMAWPNFSGGGPNDRSRIIGNLRQIDAAMQLWSLEHHELFRTSSVSITKEDLSPYLQRMGINGWVTSVAGEEYTVTSLNKDPEAKLTRDVLGWPKGSIIRLNYFPSNGVPHVLLPDPSSIDKQD